MILFILGAVSLTGLAIGFILPALLNRRPVNRDDSDRHNIRIARRRLREIGELEESGPAVDADPGDDAARAEIEASLLDDLRSANNGPGRRPPKIPGKAWTMVIVGAIPLVSAGLYLGLGTPAALPPHRPVASELSDTVSSGQTPSVAALVAQLERKLAANPGNAEGWALAGATYMRLGRFEDAERAYQTLHQLVGDDPQVLTAWADAALMANDGAFSPQIQVRIERALALHPDHDNALWLAALGAESRADYRQALAYLERLLPLVEDDPQSAAEVTGVMARVRQSRVNASSGDAQPSAGVPKAAVRVEVRLDPKLAGEVGADHRLFVFAKAVDGPPMPLAVTRHRASELPLALTLDDSMAMLDGLKISAFERVSVMARLSRTGDPIARPGDIESAAVITGTTNPSPLNLVLDRMVRGGGDADAGRSDVKPGDAR